MYMRREKGTEELCKADLMIANIVGEEKEREAVRQPLR